MCVNVMSYYVNVVNKLYYLLNCINKNKVACLNEYSAVIVFEKRNSSLIS